MTLTQPTPTNAYLVCATPRSGSTLLCELLKSTGIAGHPDEFFEDLQATGRPHQPRQYFDGVDDPELLDLLAPTEPGEPITEAAFRATFVRALEQGTTPNGVFAAKVMWGYLPDLLRGLRALPQTDGLRAADALAAAFGDPRYVQVVRRDKVAQAASMWTAVQTAQWRDEGDGAGAHEPVYAFTGIDHFVEQLAAQERAWTRWFAGAGIDPLVVVYEDLVQAPRKGAHDVLAGLGLEPADVPTPRMRQQSGARSATWIARYHEDRDRVQVAA